MNMKRSLMAVLVVLLSACANYQRDVQTMCDAPKQASIANAQASEKGTLLSKYLYDNIKSNEGQDFYARIMEVMPTQREGMLREQAGKHGITDCAMADMWRDVTAKQ